MECSCLTLLKLIVEVDTVQVGKPMRGYGDLEGTCIYTVQFILYHNNVGVETDFICHITTVMDTQ